MDVQRIVPSPRPPALPRGPLLAALAALSLSPACASKSEAPAPAAGSAAATAAQTAQREPAEGDRDAKSPAAKEKGGARSSREEVASPPPVAGPEVGSGERATDELARPGTQGPKPGSGTGETPLAAVAVVTGGRVTRESITQVLSENLERFRPCAKADAKVELRLTLGPAGSVASAEAPRSQPDDARLRDCVVDAVRALRFPRDPGSDTSVVSFELVLTRPPF